MHDLELGDIIISNTKTNTAKTIQLFTGEKFSHISILATPQMTVETCLQKNEFSLQPYDFYRDVEHYVMRPRVPKEVREAAATNAKGYLGRRYGRKSLANIALNHHTGLSFPKSFYENDYTCSCMVNASYNYLFGEHGKVSPWQILRSDKVRYINHYS